MSGARCARRAAGFCAGGIEYVVVSATSVGVATLADVGTGCGSKLVSGAWSVSCVLFGLCRLIGGINVSDAAVVVGRCCVARGVPWLGRGCAHGAGRDTGEASAPNRIALPEILREANVRLSSSAMGSSFARASVCCHVSRAMASAIRVVAMQATLPGTTTV